MSRTRPVANLWSFCQPPKPGWADHPYTDRLRGGSVENTDQTLQLSFVQPSTALPISQDSQQDVRSTQPPCVSHPAFFLFLKINIYIGIPQQH